MPPGKLPAGLGYRRFHPLLTVLTFWRGKAPLGFFFADLQPAVA